VLESGQYILGVEVEGFEAAAAAMTGSRFAAALMALGIGLGDEGHLSVFFATVGCIARVGTKPKLPPRAPECFNLDPAGLEALITACTQAIIPVHLFGQPADMDELLDIARRKGLRVIEDAG
jgi:dTDP-4-amino-4,6-dideoxygalactose transaminase